jgi:hypothetical protein
MKQELNNGMALSNFSLIDILGNQQHWGVWLKEAKLSMPPLQLDTKWIRWLPLLNWPD